MLTIYPPDQIPIHFFFFGWKKTVRYLQTDQAFYDSVEVEMFNRNLYKNLRELQCSFRKGEYETDPTLTYLLPKSMNDFKRRARPMVQFSFRDQVAWATVMLVLGEWFDSSEEIAKRIPLHQENLRQNYRWMVPWSFNNRIKRMHQVDDRDGSLKRLLVHYNHKDIYESFQWGLRNLREARKTHFENIRTKHGDVYYGELDIKEFYPTLKMSFVVKSIRSRFEQLQVCAPNMKIYSEQWMHLLNKLCQFKINFKETLELPGMNDRESISQLKESIDIGDQESLSEFLKETLPIGLIASGFLANCALTHYFDRPLDTYISTLLNKNNKDQLYILRYTDDITIISNRSNFIIGAMDEAVRTLKTLGLRISQGKTKPLEYQYDRNEQAQEQLEKAVPVVKRRERIPGSTAVIERLSKFGEHKLWAMNHEQLLNYVSEMMNLMLTKFESSEIKDETKVAFAAWRLQRSAAETSYRKLTSLEYTKVPNALRDAVFEFPYKTSLIEIYVMHLFQSARDEGIVEELKEFLQNFRQSSRSLQLLDEDDHLGSYGAYLRTSAMVAIGDHWSIVPLALREQINGILFEQLSTWYETPPTWHERASMYRMLSITNLKLDPGAVNASHIQAEPPHVAHMFRLFQCNSQVKEALFRITTEGEFDSQNLTMLRVILQVFYLRKPKEHRIRQLLLQEEEQWIRWCWSILLKESRYKQSLVYKQFVLCLARYNRTLVPKHGYETLLGDLSSEGILQEFEEDALIYRNELFHFLDLLVEDWIDYPIHKGHVTSFLDALKEFGQESSQAIIYVKQRLSNLAWIKLHICKSRNGISRLPESVLEQIQNSKKGQNQPSPLLLDWIAVTASQTMSKEDKYMHRLSEYEIIYIIRLIAERLNKESCDIQDVRMRGIHIVPKDWSAWRQGIIERADTGGLDEHLIIQPLSSDKDPDWFYIKRALDYMNNASTSMEHDTFKPCFVLTVLMVQLLSHGRLNASAFDFSKILSWKGVQYVIDECDAPSSSVISLITSTVNYFYLFYKELYDQLGNVKIPYQPLISKDTVDLDLFISRIKEIERAKYQQYLYCEHGILEVRIENIDSWTKEQ